MLSVFALALAMAAEAPAAQPAAPAAETAPAYGPPVPRRPAPKLDKIARAERDKQCADARETIADKTTILVCGQPNEQYRLDPDVLAATKNKRRGGREGAPRPPENYAQSNCSTVGPMGCRGGPIIDFISAALVAAQIAQKVAKGEDVGKLFVTNPRPSEYDYYKMAKSEREAKELEQAANEAVARARDAKAARPAAARSAPPAN